MTCCWGDFLVGKMDNSWVFDEIGLSYPFVG